MPNKTKAELEREALAAFRRKQSEGMAQAKADAQKKAQQAALKKKAKMGQGNNYFARGIGTAMGGLYDTVTGLFK
ncbi:hypothetical protein UFOVP344_27 [uncultured Caudovirales phage]|uniref:Uncharacterized protein n=1 Tax=uncultured Caudovirales phage TaxID=2100421 RepID=A0A6J5LW90_9CAUD|nr:hypothetical protein UFOVP344_27 [uncultured Caudovirales phage]